MAKYRITSIPQARYGGVFNKPTKIAKGRNDVSEEPQEAMVEVQNVKQPSYWNQMQSSVMQGKQCPPGKYEFNGECLTETEYIAASNEEQRLAEEKLNQRRNTSALDLEKLREENRRQSEVLYKNDLDKYFETFDASKKSDKIEPYEVFPLSNLTKDTEEELKKQFLIHKNSKTGQAELYPLNVAYDRIVNNGFQADQFKNYWGIDPKQVKEQLGPLMTAAKEQYDATVTNKIIDQAVREGKTVSEVVKNLPSSLGNQEALKAYIKPAQKQINKAFDFLKNEYSGIGNEITKDALSKSSKDQDIFFSNDPQAAWEKRYHNNDMMYQADKFERGQKSFDDWMTKYGSSNPDIKYAQDDQMAMQRNANQRSVDNVNLAIASNKRTSAENKDFETAKMDFLSNLGAPAQSRVLMQALTELNDKDKAKYLGMLEKDPNLAMQSLLKETRPNSKKTYQDLLSESFDADFYHAATNKIKQGTPRKPLTTGDKIKDVLHRPFDAAYFALNPRETMYGNSDLTYDEKVDAKDKLGIDLGTMPDYSPMWAMNQAVNTFNPFKIGMNLRQGYDEGDFTGALGKELWDIGTTAGGMRGLGAIGKGTGVLKPLLSNTLSNPFVDASILMGLDENVENATDAFNQGDYKTAAMEAGLAGLAALPAYRFLKGAKGIPNPSYYDFNTTVQPTQNILNSKGLLGYKEGGASGCPPGYTKVGGKCKKINAFVTSDPDEYAFRKAAYDDSLWLHQNNLKPLNTRGLIGYGIFRDDLKKYDVTAKKGSVKDLGAIYEKYKKSYPNRHENFKDAKVTSPYENKAQLLAEKLGIDHPNVHYDHLDYSIARFHDLGIPNPITGNIIKTFDIPLRSDASRYWDLNVAARYKKPVQPVLFQKETKPIKKTYPPVIKKPVTKIDPPIDERVFIEQPQPPTQDNYPPVPPIPVPPGPPPPPPFNGVEPFIEGTPIPEYATPDPDAQWVDQTERYIDWDANRIPYRFPRFRKPGHSGDLIKPGKRRYISLPGIETRNSAYIQREDEEYEDGGNLSKANLGQIVKAGKNIGRMANIGTVGTANTLAKTIAPIMWNPAMIAQETGPFTGSPLNVLPFYGKEMPYTNNTAFRKFGDTLDYVKLTGELNPNAGPLLRLGKQQIANEGNWAALGKPNEQYTGVFGAQFNRDVPGSDISWKNMSNRNGVLVTDAKQNLKPGIPISDPGLSFHRRLPFSNRYVPINMDALRNDEFDPRTMGGNLQSLLERYGYAAGIAGGLGLMGNSVPQEYLDEYVNDPVQDLLENPWSNKSKPLKAKGGVVTKLSKKEIEQYIKEGYIIEDE